MNFIEYLFDEELEAQDFTVDLVAKPAHGVEAVSMAEEDVFMSAIDDEKRLVIGPVLIPNKKIPRKGGRMAVFKKKEITKIMNNFVSNHNNGEMNVHHKYKVGDCPMVRNWQVDRKNGIMAGYGFDSGDQKVPDGTWMGGMFVGDDDVWQNDVKSGEVRGFSIKGKLKAESVQMSETDHLLWQVEQLTKEIFSDLNKYIDGK